MDSRLYIVLCQLYLFMKRKSLCRMIKKQSSTKSIDTLWIANICFSCQASLFWKTIGSEMTTTHCCLFILCYFFYRFSHTYAQSIGLYDMHPLSVKRRRFDTFQLLLPFNGPIKLFYSHPFDQSDALVHMLISWFCSLLLAPQGSTYPLI